MTPLLRLLDVRPTEVRPLAAVFGGLLFIVIAHTTLETVRDATFLTHVGPGGLGYMYIVTAALTLAVGAISSSLGASFGVRRALVATQLASAAGAAAFCFLPPTKIVLTALYAFSALSGALLVPQLWATAAASFHAGQGRRLFGTIAIAGLLGAVLGSLIAATALLVVDLRWLFLVSAGSFGVSAAVIGLAPPPSERPAGGAATPDGGAWRGAFKAEPFLVRIALVVALGAVTTLLVDYLFKAAAAAHIPSAQLGSFFARYYAAMNVLALLVQIAFARRILARAGVVGTASLMPGLMLMGSVAGFLSGSATLAVLATRAVDGSLRHSVHRTGVELLYLAVPSRARARAKPIIDGAITRISQAAAAALILLAANWGRAPTHALAFVALCSAAGWTAAAFSLRDPYVALFRRALLGGDHDEARTPEELDLASVELLVEALSSPRPREAIAATEALARRGRAGLVPALLLLRDEEDVLERALDLFASSPRTDWIHLCERLMSDPRERVRRATMRALARAHSAPGEKIAAGERPWIRGYLAIGASLSNTETLALLTPDADGREVRLGMLTALGDAAPDPRLASLLQAIVDRESRAGDREMVDLVARAAARVGATELVPWLMDALALHGTRGEGSPHRLWRGPAEGRATVRAALATLGEPAFDRIEAALIDRRTPRCLRMHLPLTLAEFKSGRAVNVLLGFLRDGDDGHVRYRCLRALERLATESGLRVPSGEARALVRRELAEYFRLLALRNGLDPVHGPSPAAFDDPHDIMVCLLDDKCAQAIERAFRLLELCFPSEDLLQVHAAVTSGEPSTRANAIEFLDALLAPRRRHEHDGIRGLLRLFADDLPDAERVARAAVVPPGAIPRSPEAAIALLRGDRDVLVATLALSLEQEHGS
jgi:AAA family ATP:ADP antiporter